VPLRHPNAVQFDWDPKKNDFLKTTRNVCFETVMVHLGRGDLWRVAEHPNQEKYSGQKLFFVPIDDYIYIIPFEERGEVIWLVTIIPSRKATKMYLEEINNETE
jgi:hypothetical protein